MRRAKENLIRPVNLIMSIPWFLIILFFIYVLLVNTYGALDVDVFDGSLRIISSVYSSNGLIPYRDFGVVYPPGYFFLVGQILPYTSPLDLYLTKSVIYLFIVLTGTLVIIKNDNFNKNELGISYILISSLIILRFGRADAFSFLLPGLLLLSFTSDFLHNNKDSSGTYARGLFLRGRSTPISSKRWFILKDRLVSRYNRWNYKLSILIIFLSPLLGIWYRWDFLLMILITSLPVIIILHILRRFFITSLEIDQLKTTLLIYTTGLLIGFVTLMIYLDTLRSLNEGLDFIFNIPTKVIGSYRDLPLPKLKLRPLQNNLFYITLFFHIYLLTKATNIYTKALTTKSKILPTLPAGIFIVFFPFNAFLYAMGRSGFNHFLPYWYLTFMAWVIFFGIHKQKLSKTLLIFLTLLPFITWFRNDDYFKYSLTNSPEGNIEAKISDCKLQASSVSPKSLFVGRLDYSHFIYSYAILYLTFPQTKPATSFISDEPGLQNSCKYGKLIFQQLEMSDKPMLAFIETSEQPREQNKTENMSSCGFIEKFIVETPFKSLGDCVVDKSEFAIRLYE